MKKVAAALTAAVALLASTVTASDVLDLTKDTFHTAVTPEDLMLVEFFARRSLGSVLCMRLSADMLCVLLQLGYASLLPCPIRNAPLMLTLRTCMIHLQYTSYDSYIPSEILSAGTVCRIPLKTTVCELKKANTLSSVLQAKPSLPTTRRQRLSSSRTTSSLPRSTAQWKTSCARHMALVVSVCPYRLVSI